MLAVMRGKLERFQLVQLKEIYYGDGIDGSITRTSSGVLYTTDYTIESGVTRTVSGTTIIHAQNKITIDGTLDATGAGASEVQQEHR